MEVLGRAAPAELQGSEAGVEFDAQGSLLLTAGAEGGAPHGSTGATGLGADPCERGRGRGACESKSQFGKAEERGQRTGAGEM